MYRQVIENNKLSDQLIQRISDSAFIPCSEENLDYREYLEWAKTHMINPPKED